MTDAWLDRLMGAEAEVEAQSREFVSKDADTQRHTHAVAHALRYFAVAVKESTLNGDRHKAMRILAVRCFKSGEAARRLALLGYYQSAVGLVRDIIETTDLLDLFDGGVDLLDKWLAHPDSREFSPGAVRGLLEKRKPELAERRKERYQMFSRYGTHPTAASMRLTIPHGQLMVDPVFDPKLLHAVTYDLAAHLLHAASCFGVHLEEDESEKVAVAAEVYLKVATEWRAAMFPPKAE